MQHRFPARACTFLGLVLFALSGRAQAQQSELAEPLEVTQPPTAPDVTPPPAACLPQPRAAALFAEGTKLFKQWRFEEAEEKYREALTHGRHPLIHLYLSRALEKQGRLVEAYEALQRALRKGARPLLSEDVRVAEKLQKDLESRLAQLEVHCDMSGVEVFLDGQPWFRSPGRQRRVMNTGRHVLVARKPGYFPVTEPLSLATGKQTRIVLRMTEDVVHVERRWQEWQPWVLAGTGIAISLTGGLLRLQAAIDYASIEDAFDSCPQESSCQFVPTQRFDSALWKERVGTSALIIGGSLLAAGLAGVLLNQPRIQRTEPGRGMEYEILPMATRDTAGIALRIQF